MKKVLLLGSNGQLGSDIQKIFGEEKNIETIPVTRKQIDVENLDLIHVFLEKHNDAHYLINCISYHKTDEVEDFPQKAFTINAIAVRELAKFCNKYGTVFIHISTDYVFDGTKNAPYYETDCPAPLNVYGNSKLAGEYFVQSYHDKYFILRVSSLFGFAGSSGKGGNFVETMIRLAKEGKTLSVVHDQIMSPTHTLDIARAIRTLVQHDISDYGIYHCSGEGQCSWFEFAKEIFRQTGLNPKLFPISAEEYKTKAKRPKYSVLSNEKLNRFYKMKDWKEALTEYLVLKGYI